MTLSASDSQLMAQVNSGRVEAFAEIYDRFCDRAYRVAFAVCRDAGDAEDAVQDAFLSVWSGPSTFRSHQGTVAAWLLTGVRYRAIDVTRRNARHVAHRANEHSLSERSAPDDVSQKVVRRDEADRLLDSLAQLPDRQREVIVLAYYGELSHSEIAVQLGLPAGTVKGRMRLGLQRLRANVEHVA